MSENFCVQNKKISALKITIISRIKIKTRENRFPVMSIDQTVGRGEQSFDSVIFDLLRSSVNIILYKDLD